LKGRVNRRRQKIVCGNSEGFIVMIRNNRFLLAGGKSNRDENK